MEITLRFVKSADQKLRKMKIHVQDAAAKILKKNTSAEYWVPNYSNIHRKM